MNVESIRIIDGGDDFKQIVARVSVDRTETIQNGDVFPHFEGHRYRSLGAMSLIDGPDGEWKKDARGIEVRTVEVGVVEVEPDGTSFIKFRMSSKLLTWPDGEKIISRGRRKKKKRKR